jgi:hypothetical protein
MLVLAAALSACSKTYTTYERRNVPITEADQQLLQREMDIVFGEKQKLLSTEEVTRIRQEMCRRLFPVTYWEVITTTGGFNTRAREYDTGKYFQPFSAERNEPKTGLFKN